MTHKNKNKGSVQETSGTAKWTGLQNEQRRRTHEAWEKKWARAHGPPPYGATPHGANQHHANPRTGLTKYQANKWTYTKNAMPTYLKIKESQFLPR